MSEKPTCPYRTEAEREAAKKRRGDDCCCCIKAPFQPWHGRRCPHGMGLVISVRDMRDISTCWQYGVNGWHAYGAGPCFDSSKQAIEYRDWLDGHEVTWTSETARIHDGWSEREVTA